jgi:hypothetical protein
MTPLVMERPVKWLVNLFFRAAPRRGVTMASGGHEADGKRLRAHRQS